MAAPVRRLAGTLEAGGHPPVVDLRPAADWPDTANVVVNLCRVRAVIDRVAGDLDELARALVNLFIRQAAKVRDPQVEHMLRNLTGIRPFKP